MSFLLVKYKSKVYFLLTWNTDSFLEDLSASESDPVPASSANTWADAAAAAAAAEAWAASAAALAAASFCALLRRSFSSFAYGFHYFLLRFQLSLFKFRRKN